MIVTSKRISKTLISLSSFISAFKLYSSSKIKFTTTKTPAKEIIFNWASFKFLQKLWSLNEKICKNKKKFSKFDEELEKFRKTIEKNLNFVKINKYLSIQIILCNL